MTIDEMARDLGVSKSTISRALSGKGRIGEETRQRIRNYAKENDFTPKTNIRLNRAQTRNIGIVISSDAYAASIPFFQDCLFGVCEAALLQEYNVLITTRTDYDITGIQTLVEKKKVDGIILTRSMEDDRALKYLTGLDFPVGVTGTCSNNNVIQVDCDNRAASESLTSILIGRGYRRFAMILGNLAYSVNRRRSEGVRNAIEKSGLIAEQQIFYTGFEKVDFIDNIIGEIMSRKVECIICGDDVICTKIMSRLQAEGYRIPMDISVASLYNSSNLNCFSPAITTVNISAREVGNVIGKQMINYLSGNEYVPKSILEYDILFRKSTIMTYNGRGG